MTGDGAAASAAGDLDRWGIGGEDEEEEPVEAGGSGSPAPRAPADPPDDGTAFGRLAPGTNAHAVQMLLLPIKPAAFGGSA
jgi:hypothetical protein